MYPYPRLHTQRLANLSYGSGEREEGARCVGEAFCLGFITFSAVCLGLSVNEVNETDPF